MYPLSDYNMFAWYLLHSRSIIYFDISIQRSLTLYNCDLHELTFLENAFNNIAIKKVISNIQN